MDTSSMSLCYCDACQQRGAYCYESLADFDHEKTIGFAVGFSKVSDIYGRRNLLAIAWVFFAGFSVWCALAGSMRQLYARLSFIPSKLVQH